MAEEYDLDNQPLQDLSVGDLRHHLAELKKVACRKRQISHGAHTQEKKKIKLEKEDGSSDRSMDLLLDVTIALETELQRQELLHRHHVQQEQLASKIRSTVDLGDPQLARREMAKIKAALQSQEDLLSSFSKDISIKNRTASKTVEEKSNERKERNDMSNPTAELTAKALSEDQGATSAGMIVAHKTQRGSGNRSSEQDDIQSNLLSVPGSSMWAVNHGSESKDLASQVKETDEEEQTSEDKKGSLISTELQQQFDKINDFYIRMKRLERK